MPPETPPSRVKKAWRRPGMAESSGDASVMRVRLLDRLLVAEPGQRGQVRFRDRQHLEHRPMPPRPPPTSRFSAPEMSSETSAVLRHQGDRAGFDAEPLQELALRHRAVDARAEILGGARPAPGNRHGR